ncbi:MAG TPA: hypothetical protein P5287_08465, partial [bacterium]|nr:hypothetical protein [bacterium]
MNKAGSGIFAVIIMLFVSADLHAVAFFDNDEMFVANPSTAAHWRSSYINDTAGDVERYDMSNRGYVYAAKHGLSYGIESTFLNTDPDFAANNAPAIQAIRSAFATWDIASDALDFFDAGIEPLGGDASHIAAGLNVDIFSAPSGALNPITGSALFGANTLAVTDIYFWNDDHTIATVNMWFNEAKNWSVSGVAGQY